MNTARSGTTFKFVTFDSSNTSTFLQNKFDDETFFNLVLTIIMYLEGLVKKM